jgi:uncharacterized membrane protein YeaQ/YmgE (transglycosylase-associated protein family)
MNFSQLAIQILLAIACAGIAKVLISRSLPGGLAGLLLIGFVGVLLGEWSFALLTREFGLSHPLLRWHIEGVEVLPAIAGSAIVIYILASILSYGRYDKR